MVFEASLMLIISVANCEHYSWSFTSLQRKKQQYNELKGLTGANLINNDKDVNK